LGESSAANLTVYLSLTKKTFCLPYYSYVFSSTELNIRAEQVLPGSEGARRGGRRGEGRMAWRRNDPNNVCTCK
jgi:hypothetical protein